MRKHKHGLPTIGILYPGEMGASLGRLLLEHGYPVVTTTQGRSPRTRRLCTDAGLSSLDGVEQVVAASQILISLVPPDAAIQVAEQSLAIASKLSASPTYVDANSISPGTVASIAERMTGSGVRLIDAAIHGLAHRLREQGTLYLSGAGAEEVASLFSGVIRVDTLGERLGLASLLKMLLGGVSKGLVGLILEMSLVSREAGLLAPFLRSCRDYYPGVLEVTERILPTVPRHAGRRAQEMRELERTLDSLGLRASLAREIGWLYELVSDSGLSEDTAALDLGSMAIRDLLELIVSRVSLRGDVANDTVARAATTSP